MHYREKSGFSEKGGTGGTQSTAVWPPAWWDRRSSKNARPSPKTLSISVPEPSLDLVKEPPDRPTIEPSVPSPPEAPPELEAFLQAILGGVLARTDDPEIIQSAKNLLDICRDQLQEGKPDVAWGNARYLQKQIPDYLTQRRIP